MNAITRATAGAFRTLKGAAGTRIVYAQTDPRPQTERLTAVLGRSTMAIDSGGGGGYLEAISLDFIVEAVDLRGMTPGEGDIITVDETGAQYQVMTPPYSPSDHAGTRLRIHTKRIANG